MGFRKAGKQRTVSFVHCRTEDPNADRFERHCHCQYEVLYIVEGRGKFVVEGMEYPLCKGMLMLLRPHEYHFVQPESGYPYERIYLNFNATDPLVNPDAMTALQVRGGTGLCYLPESLVCGVGELLSGMGICTQLEDGQKEALFRGGLTQLLLTLSASTPVDERSGRTLAADVMRYLSDNLERELRLEELAQKFFVSKYHLCRVFRSHAGVTVLEYLTAKRIARAQALLSQGLSAAEAAEQTGFSDYSTFYRAYRRCTGGPPSHQRKCTKH